MKKFWQWKIKYLLDYPFALFFILLTLPLMIVIVILIKLDDGGPIFFVQPRLGKDGKVFKMIKFRTMAVNSPIQFNPDGSTKVLPKDPRITRVGRYLRGFLDELPQLFHVLTGKMSLVGPRPDLPEQRKLYSKAEAKKLLVKPGITNLPAVSGRDNIPWKERIAMDLHYLDNYSLWLDFKIIVKTIILAVKSLLKFDSSSS